VKQPVAILALVSVIVVGLIVLGISLTAEAPVALVLGWWSYLARTVPQVRIYWPSVAVGVVAALLFTAGVHWAGQSWRHGGGWKLRWSLTITVAVSLVFVAGLCVVGVVHQTGWLLSAKEEELGGEGLAWGSSSEFHLMDIGSAMKMYADSDRPLPPGGSFTADGAMLHSWETHILPYMWYLQPKIDMNRAWNDPVNQKHFKSLVYEFINPEFRVQQLVDGEGYCLSHYAANSHVLGANKRMKLSEISDGASNTFLIGEVNANFKPWGHPINFRDPAAGINRSPNGFGGPPGSGGALFCMADGSVRFVSEQVSPEVLMALSTPNGGEKIRAETIRAYVKSKR
jgi:hypothetical protein